MARLKVSSNIDINKDAAAIKSDENGVPIGSVESGVRIYTKEAKEDDN